MYYPIDENTARLSHQMMSMSDYKEGSATAGYRAAVDEAIKSAPAFAQTPFPDFELSSLRGKIKRIKDRLAQLRRVDEMEHTEIEFDGGTITTNEDVNRVQILFDEKPDDATRSKLKTYGFRWSRTEGAWQTQRTPQNLRRACYILGVDPPKPSPAPTANGGAAQQAAPLATPEEAPPLELPTADDGQALFPLN